MDRKTTEQAIEKATMEIENNVGLYQNEKVPSFRQLVRSRKMEQKKRAKYQNDTGMRYDKYC